jgi:diguanylate cyclase (GGDEF)-like protein
MLMMEDPELSQYKEHIKKRLASFYGIFAKASVGDYSEDAVIPPEGDEFAKLAAGIQGMIEVIRERISELEAEVVERKYQAAHDPLTGLPNRHSFEERARVALEAAQRDNKKLALLYLDIDRFKQVNDVFGHYVGDMLLQEFARRVGECITSDDIVGRFGGDEFVVILTNIKTRSEVTRTIKKIIKALESPMPFESRTVFLSTSIGVAMFPEEGSDMQTLLANSDVALLHAKQAGRNHYNFYEASMNREASSKMNVVQELRQALLANQIKLYYQPVIDAVTHKVVNVEALLRWQHPERGLLPASEFISIAEDHGIMKKLGEETLKTVFSQQGEWQRKGVPPTRIAINLSPREFTDSRFIEKVKRLLSENNISPALLEFEIVENLAMENIALAKDRFKLLRKMGITIAIDDFGIGYSSLGYLKDLPIDVLKIDQSFIKHSMTNSQNQAIIKAIVALGHSLHMKVVAEGVESEDQLHLLRELGCDGMQGYYIARPMPAEKLAQWASKFEPII